MTTGFLRRCSLTLTVLLGAISAALAAGDPVRDALGEQAERLRAEGRYAEAITVTKRIVTMEEATTGLETPLGATLLNNLGEYHYQLRLYAEAVPYYERSLAIGKKTIQADNPITAMTERNLATVYQLLGRTNDAEQLYQQSMATFSRLPGSAVQLASTANNLAGLYQDTGRTQAAEDVLLGVLKVYHAQLGPAHPYVATALNNLGGLYKRAGNLQKAWDATRQAYDIARAAQGPDHLQVARFAYSLAGVLMAAKDYAKAVPLLREALGIVQRDATRGAATREGQLSATLTAELALQRALTGDFINAAMKVVTTDQTQAVELVREIFAAGQWRPSQVSQSLLEMSVRRAKGDGPLAELIRTRQDLVAEWHTRDTRLTAALTAISAATAGGIDIKSEVAKQQDADARIAALDQKLATQFPDYAALINPKPIDVPGVQALLRDNEALVLFIETPQPSWVWAITKTDKALAFVGPGREDLTEQAEILRCGLDSQSWLDPTGWPDTRPADARRKTAQAKRLARCRTQAGGRQTAPGSALPFDTAHAHNLYRTLFGGVAKVLAGKELLIVPSPALAQLPFNALVTVAPDGDPADMRKIKWLGTEQAITILPSLATLAALRTTARPSSAKKTYAGFGNPLLEGRPGNDAARLAKARQTCRQTLAARVSAQPTARNAAVPVGIGSTVQETQSIAEIVRQQAPLPETADEVCDVARHLGAADLDIWLGARATATEIKALSASGKLADYRILHFATHGLAAGVLPGLAEPALILTPPATGSAADDGVLTASEVAQLKLDADWVVLSACNTAAGGSDGAEAFSGLTRAFFYAGARSLLVTHWEIVSDAAVALTTKAFEIMQQEPRVGRAEAMRRSMAALAGDATRPWAAHPAVWAAFALIGEGGAAR